MRCAGRNAGVVAQHVRNLFGCGLWARGAELLGGAVLMRRRRGSGCGVGGEVRTVGARLHHRYPEYLSGYVYV